VWQSAADCLSWNSPGPLASTNAVKPVITVNSDGAAVASWSERTTPTAYPQVVITTRDTVNNWSLINSVPKPGDDASDRNPVVGLPDIGGQAFVVWEQTSNGMGSVWWRMFNTATNAWLTNAAPLDTSDTMRAYAPAIATNHSGNVIVTYLERTLSTTRLWSRRLSAGMTSFAAPVMVAEAAEIDASIPPSVMLDDAGTATAAWGQLVGGKYNATVGQAASGATTWTVTPLETDDAAADDGAFGTTSFATMPIVRGNGQGIGFAVWRKRISNVRFDLFAKRLASGTWGPEMKLETIDVSSGATASVFNPTLDVNGSAQAAVAWYYGGTGVPLDVYANLFR
jgi:hypothetical protein